MMKEKTVIIKLKDDLRELTKFERIGHVVVQCD